MPQTRRQNKTSAPPATTGQSKGRGKGKAPAGSSKDTSLQIEPPGSSGPSGSGQDCPPKGRQNKTRAPPATTGKSKGRGKGKAPAGSSKDAPLQIESPDSSRPSSPGQDCPPNRPPKTSAPSATTGKQKGRGKGKAPVGSNKAIPPQIESSSSSRPPSSGQDSTATAEPKPITIHGRKYYKAEDLTRGEIVRTKTSSIWESGYEIIDTEDGSKHYYCCLCLDMKENPAYTPLLLNGTSTIQSHIKSKHQNKKQNENAIAGGSRSASRAPTASPAPGYMFKSAFETIKFLLIQWIVCAHISFLQLENKYFQDFLYYLTSAIPEFLPSRNTFRGWVLEEFKKQKKMLKKELKKARSNIHLSFDLWSSPNCHSIIAIVSHFISSKGSRESRLLAIRQMEGEHSGENMAGTVLQVIREYKISKRIGFFVLDNVSSNDVAVDHILCSLYPEMSPAARKRRRLRCLAHVINLVAKAFLLGPKADDVTDELSAAQRHCDYEKLTAIWQNHGPLGRLQNLIRHIRLTPQRREKFRACQVDKGSWKEFNKLEV